MTIGVCMYCKSKVEGAFVCTPCSEGALMRAVGEHQQAELAALIKMEKESVGQSAPPDDDDDDDD